MEGIGTRHFNTEVLCIGNSLIEINFIYCTKYVDHFYKHSKVEFEYIVKNIHPYCDILRENNLMPLDFIPPADTATIYNLSGFVTEHSKCYTIAIKDNALWHKYITGLRRQTECGPKKPERLYSLSLNKDTLLNFLRGDE